MVKSRLVSGGAIAIALSVGALAAGGSAKAADYLRGAYAGDTEPKSAGVDWAGVYGGVHAGASVGQVDPRPFARPLANQALPNTILTDTVARMINFRETNKMGTSYGGFVGVNWVWDDVVLGIEADYTRSNIRSNSNSNGAVTFRPTGTTDEYDIITNATARARLSDWGTLRGRVGWAAGMFMPYLTAGVAFGNVDGRSTLNGTWARFDVSAPPARPLTGNGVFASSVGRSGITYGGAFGAGVDMQLLPNTFLRAEWQHIQFASGGQRPNISINTARIGGGIKF